MELRLPKPPDLSMAWGIVGIIVGVFAAIVLVPLALGGHEHDQPTGEINALPELPRLVAVINRDGEQFTDSRGRVLMLDTVASELADSRQIVEIARLRSLVDDPETSQRDRARFTEMLNKLESAPAVYDGEWLAPPTSEFDPRNFVEWKELP